MLEVLKIVENKIVPGALTDENIWVKLTAPVAEEITEVQEKFAIDLDFLKAALDQEEVSRLETLEDSVLVLINASTEEGTATGVSYTTIPIGIIIKDNVIITVTLEELKTLERLKKYSKENASINKKTKFVFQILYNVALQYLMHLRRIDIMTNTIEKELYANTKTEYLMQLLTLEKNLVYFLTALKSNEQVLNKILRFKALPIYAEDEDLFEDVIIELKQAQEMATINSKVIRSIRDAFSSLMSYSLNNTMKILASVTIILTVPTMIYSFFGMNTGMGNIIHSLTATLIIFGGSLILSIILYKIMKNKNMF